MPGFVRFVASNGYQDVLLPIDRIVRVTGWTEKAKLKHPRSTIYYLKSNGIFGGTAEVEVDHSVEEVESRIKAVEQA